MNNIRSFFRYTAIGRILYIPIRFMLGLSYITPIIKNLFVWTFTSHETDNFTYDISDDNKEYLTAFISHMTRTPYQRVLLYMQEIEKNNMLLRDMKSEIIKTKDRYHIDKKVYLGRRIGWYLLVRILKPHVVVETGVEKGIGACVLTFALMKNAREGHKGVYYGTEIDPTAGDLFKDPYDKFGKILIGDSVTSLRKLPCKIDLFIHDSDHNASYEMKEYMAVKDKLTKHAYVVSDNAHSTDSLFRFAQESGREFLYFQEKPIHHWYPGAGIGVAFRK